MDERDKAWLAGFFDGEGSIYINRMMYNTKRGFNPSYYVDVALCNTEKSLMDHLQTLYPGNTGIYHRKDTRHKDVYKWSLSARRAVDFISLIQPYLRSEKKISQAELATEFQEGIRAFEDKYAFRRGKFKGFFTKLPDEELARREKIWRLMHEIGSKKGGNFGG